MKISQEEKESIEKKSHETQELLIDFFEMNSIPPDVAALSILGLFLKMSKRNQTTVKGLGQIFDALIEEYKQNT